jgi:hypothetical protein
MGACEGRIDDGEARFGARELESAPVELESTMEQLGRRRGHASPRRATRTTTARWLREMVVRAQIWGRVELRRRRQGGCSNMRRARGVEATGTGGCGLICLCFASRLLETVSFAR